MYDIIFLTQIFFLHQEGWRCFLNPPLEVQFLYFIVGGKTFKDFSCSLTFFCHLMYRQPELRTDDSFISVFTADTFAFVKSLSVDFLEHKAWPWFHGRKFAAEEAFGERRVSSLWLISLFRSCDGFGISHLGLVWWFTRATVELLLWLPDQRWTLTQITPLDYINCLLLNTLLALCNIH